MKIEKRLRKWASYVEESHLASRAWRSESWHDEEMYDGKQFTDEEKDAYKKIGVDLITINRTFPAVNMILGFQAINRNDISAKARTSKDSEISQTMSEGIKFVLDQNQGAHQVAKAFKNQVIPGVGNIFVGKNKDPRKEVVFVTHRDWKEVFSDPYADPWAEAGVCRYKFWQKWVDLDMLKAAFPKKEKELDELWDTLTEKTKNYDYSMDEAEQVEELKQIAIGTPWIDARRRRVRPVEIYYTKPETALFAKLPTDYEWHEIEETLSAQEQFEMANQAIEIGRFTIPRMYYAIFVSSIILQDETRSDLGHDLFPYVPFIGYVDRYGQPYGVPRQIRGQDEEVNKRRSMALALMKTRRIIIEEDAADDKEDLDNIHKEINAFDGMAVVSRGALTNGKLKIMENVELANAQIGILQQSEKEIQEISGANGEATGYRTNAVSGVAKDAQVEKAGMMVAPLFENFKFGLRMLGERIMAGIQKEWTGPKVLRVTDRLTGSDKFLEINKRMEDGRVRNGITQGRYDMIVSEAPRSDTVREKNMNLIIEWVKKSPPEIIPHLMNVAFELADLPNKEQFLEKIKPLLGYDPLEEDMDAEERKAKLLQQLEIEKQAQAKRAELEEVNISLEINKKKLENEEIQAKINELMAKTAAIRVKAESDAQNTHINAEKHEMAKSDFVLDSTNKGLDVGERITGKGERVDG